jgi:hypothetical protein
MRLVSSATAGSIVLESMPAIATPYATGGQAAWNSRGRLDVAMLRVCEQETPGSPGVAGAWGVALKGECWNGSWMVRLGKLASHCVDARGYPMTVAGKRSTALSEADASAVVVPDSPRASRSAVSTCAIRRRSSCRTAVSHRRTRSASRSRTASSAASRSEGELEGRAHDYAVRRAQHRGARKGGSAFRMPRWTLPMRCRYT